MLVQQRRGSSHGDLREREMMHVTAGAPGGRFEDIDSRARSRVAGGSGAIPSIEALEIRLTRLEGLLSTPAG